jgi:hypothetical protein
MIFDTYNTVYNSMDREYHQNAPASQKLPEQEPLLNVRELGATVTEMPGRQDLIQAVKASIKQGSATLELATNQGGPTQPVGVESYGVEARQALRELQMANKLDVVSIHTPSSLPNLSGYNPQNGRFDSEYKKMVEDEISKALRFAAETAGGGAVVVHSGEFNRPISEAEWNTPDEMEDGSKRYQFLSTMDEPNKTPMAVVEKTTGQVKSLGQKNVKIYRPKWRKATEDGVVENPYSGEKVNVKKGDYLNIDGLPIDEKDYIQRVPLTNDGEVAQKPDEFGYEELTWKDIEKEALEQNKDKKDVPVYFYNQMQEQQLAQQYGQLQYHSSNYEEFRKRREKLMQALEVYEKLEKDLPEEEKWRLMKAKGYGEFAGSENMMPTEIIKEELASMNRHLSHINSSVSGIKSQIAQMENDMGNIESMEDYALKQTFDTVAKAGYTAYEQNKNNEYSKKDKDLFVSIENLDPNTYGSHPDEIIKIIEEGREKMVEYMTEKSFKSENGDERIHNPYFQKDIKSKEEARKLAERHIKMTLDTEHLALWRKKFMPEQGETRERTNERFNKWYLKQIDKLVEKNIIGHVHLVDSIEGGHNHIPAGSGELPLKDSVKKLKEAGYKGTIVSEGHSENQRYGPDRQQVKPWQHFRSHQYANFPMHSMQMQPQTFNQVHQSFYGRNEPAMYVTGAYVPSNEWSFWSQVPLE